MTTSSIVEKSAIVLDLICASQTPMRFTDIVQRMALPKSSVHRIIEVLLVERLLEYKDSTKTYGPGPRILKWASNALNENDLPSVAAADLIKLSDATGAHVCLSVLKGTQLLYLKTIDPHEPSRLAPSVGEYSPVMFRSG